MSGDRTAAPAEPGPASGRPESVAARNAISSTLMIVLIALVTGITDLAALISIAFVNASMILFGWLMEMSNQFDRNDVVDTVLVRLCRWYRPLDRDRHLHHGQRQP